MTNLSQNNSDKEERLRIEECLLDLQHNKGVVQQKLTDALMILADDARNQAARDDYDDLIGKIAETEQAIIDNHTALDNLHRPTVRKL